MLFFSRAHTRTFISLLLVGRRHRFAEMATIWERCVGAFAGHAISSEYDPSVSMALNISMSLLRLHKFDGPDIFSQHMDLYNREGGAVGQITIDVYKEACKEHSARGQSGTRRFLFEQSTIDRLVKTVNNNCGGLTAGCGPAQRCYPLAFCPFIIDENLPWLSIDEAKLTHFSPVAGQVAAIVNVICRGLIRGKPWADAVNAAFSMARLHEDIRSIPGTYARWPQMKNDPHPSYAPSVLNTALNCVNQSSSMERAVEIAKYEKNGFYCKPIAGILAGARWGLSEEMKAKHEGNRQFANVCHAANELAKLWPSNPEALSS